jgi:hypothetical protein
VFFGAVDALGAERLSFVLRSIVIVSTGPPEACIPADIEQMIAVTASNGIRLYWVGLGGEAPSDAATDDLAGLTFTNETDVSGAVSDFESWFGLTPICEWEIGPPPSFPHVDANQVRVVVEPAGGRSQTVPGVPSAELCSPNGGVGWYYEDPEARSRIVLCPETCLLNRGGGLGVFYGCTDGAPRR